MNVDNNNNDEWMNPGAQGRGREKQTKQQQQNETNQIDTWSNRYMINNIDDANQTYWFFVFFFNSYLMMMIRDTNKEEKNPL